MSNEELVAAIQSGNTEKMAELWDQVAGLVRRRAWRVWAAVNDSGVSSGVEFEDLYQCGYIALVAAVERYTPGKGAFSTCFVNALKTVFAEATDFRTKKRMLDPLHRAVSLDMPVGEDETTSLSEIISDPTAEAMISRVAEMEERRQCCEALSALVSELPSREREIITQRYYQNKSIPETAETIGITAKEAQRLENNAIRYFRHPARAKKIRGFWKR